MNEDLEERAVALTVADVMFIQDQMSELMGFAEHYTKHHLNRNEQLAKEQMYCERIQKKLKGAYKGTLNESEQKALNIRVY
tara:strand:+ start:2394 stop:2636 length:243 start_codon:yes stop_codon:yes gene_type:complete